MDSFRLRVEINSKKEDRGIASASIGVGGVGRNPLEKRFVWECKNEHGESEKNGNGRMELSHDSSRIRGRLAAAWVTEENGFRLWSRCSGGE